MKNTIKVVNANVKSFVFKRALGSFDGKRGTN